MDFLPVNVDDMKKCGWKQPDFILVTGDAYVDHPSFGAAVIGRLLQAEGYKTGVISMPDWRDKNSFSILPKPRLGFLVTSGNIDSMVNRYTSAKKLRSRDLYSPGGKTGLRPDRAVIVYCQKIRELYKDVPIIIGGLEASLRRLAHYDYWDNKVRRSVLIDSGADLLIYGMGERQIVEVAECLSNNIPIGEITFVKGTVYKTKNTEYIYDTIKLPSYKEICANRKKYAESFLIQYENTDFFSSKTLVEDYGGLFAVQNPPQKPLSTEELDYSYSLPYKKTYHPMYDDEGGVPAIEEVRFSIVSNRGCFGGCNFCSLTFHQGRIIQARSHQSILDEAKKLVSMPDFKGYIHDVGGPTANFRFPSCNKQPEKGVCIKKQCLFPKPCKELIIDHTDYLNLLSSLRKITGIKKIFIRSGLRYDYLIYDANEAFFNELCKHHISGQLKVAPEHVSEKVLSKMGKPGKDVYERFTKKYYEINKKLGLKQFLVPYLMSGHPGSDLKSAVELAEYLRDANITPEQVQDFYPTPGTLSTCMYYAEVDPRTGENVYVAKTSHEKAMQRVLIQYKNPKNYNLVFEALKKAGRDDLIGFDRKCLIRPKNVIGYKAKKELDVIHKSKKKKTIRNVHKKKV